MYKALYRKWRPMDFDSVCGQKHITDILKYQVMTEKVSHAYLFCGSRGTGKTTCAKILAKAVNCLHPQNGNPCNLCEACTSINNGTATDVIEMDAASNNGVENVRDIREEVIFSPAALKRRVYIIDEVHMLSQSAFNALLKTLEEPPEYVVFILATTELQKLPATIISRCQRYDFRRMTTKVLTDRLTVIAEAEGIPLEESGALPIARMAQGGMRDAISLLELCAGTGETVNEKLVTSMLGAGNRDTVFATVDAVRKKDYGTLYGIISDIVMESGDLTVFWQELINAYRDMMVMKTCRNAAAYLDLTPNEEKTLRSLAEGVSMETLLYHSSLLENALYAMQRVGFTKRSTAELTLTKMCEPSLSTEPSALLARIGKLEETVSAMRYAVPVEPLLSAEPPEIPAMPTVPEAPIEVPAKAESESAYFPLPYFGEIVDEMAGKNPSVAGFLTKARGFYSAEKGFLIRAQSEFAVTILKTEQNIALLKTLVGRKENRNISSEPFLIVSEKQSSAYTFTEDLENDPNVQEMK